jgi:hypothetical protein
VPATGAKPSLPRLLQFLAEVHQPHLISVIPPHECGASLLT